MKGYRYCTKNFKGAMEGFYLSRVNTIGVGNSFVGDLLCDIVDGKFILENEEKVLKFANLQSHYNNQKGSSPCSSK